MAIKRKAKKKPAAKKKKFTKAQKAAHFKKTLTPAQRKVSKQRAKMRADLMKKGMKAATKAGIKDPKKRYAFVKARFLKPAGFSTKRKAKKK